MLRRHGSDDTVFTHYYLHQMEQEVERLRRLVDHLLALARLDEGVPLARSPLDLAPIFSLDESILTGESPPARKVVWDGKRNVSPPGGDDLPFVYAGTLVVQGQGIAEVKATGVHTAMGTIGKASQMIEPEETPYRQCPQAHW